MVPARPDDASVFSEAVKERDAALMKALNNMRIMVSRLEELIDAPFDKQVARRVASRIGVSDLSRNDIDSQIGVTERYFQRWCHEYFLTATARVHIGVRIEPVHVTTHYPSPEPGGFLKFFPHKINEDFVKVNRDHIGDLLFRMAAVAWRQAGTEPTDYDKKQMYNVLYSRGEEGLYRRLAAETQGTDLTTRFTDFERETKARYWSLVMRGQDVHDYFLRLKREQAAQARKRKPARDHFVDELKAVADALRIIRRFDKDRFVECFRQYKTDFTAFLLDANTEDMYAVPLMRSRRRLGLRSSSMAKRAGDRHERFQQLYDLAEKADEKAAAEAKA